MADERYNAGHHAGGTPQERIANRLKNSGEGSGASVTVKHGEGPTRTVTNIHHSGQRGPMGNEGGKGPLDHLRSGR
jgi:hypothetical protein